MYEYTKTAAVHTQRVNARIRQIYVGFRERSARLLGLRPSRVLHQLDDAARALSYHLYIQGSDGTYLSNQRLVSVGPEAASSELARYTVLRRTGQDFAHVYGRRDSSEIHQAPTFEATFTERPPGSIAVASFSALASVVFVVVAAGDALGLSSINQPVAIATLLSIPAAVGAWSGLQQSRTLPGGTLAARLSDFVTISISLSAMVFYALGAHVHRDVSKLHQDYGPLGGREGFSIWMLFFAVASINAVAVFGSWMVRAFIYDSISNARADEYGGKA